MNSPVRQATAADLPELLLLRAALWPACSEAEHRRDLKLLLEHAPLARAQLSSEVLIYGETTKLGFTELSLRAYAEGCTSSPVAYVEGWFVVPKARRRGIGGALLAAAERWAYAQGCTELASDTENHNAGSQYAHLRLGFEVSETLVHFRKTLGAGR